MRGRRSSGVGSVSLTLIFATLCLAIFSVLTLSSALGEKRNAQLLAESATDYYQADSQASRVYLGLAQALSRGETPDTLYGIDIDRDVQDDGVHYSYSCEIDDRQVLEVELSYKGESLVILKWAKTSRESWSGDESLQVWPG